MSLPLVRRLGAADWSPPESIALVAQAAYHVEELTPVVAALADRGVHAEIWVPEPLSSKGGRLRPAVRRHRELLARSGREVSSPRPAPVSERAALVVMNDWGATTRPLVEAARNAGVPSFGWVEGVQDFGDVDTGADRRPYRRVDHVLALGPHSAAALAERSPTVVGSQRLWEMWRTPATAGARHRAVVNVNFTYGVLEGARREWLGSVRRACETAEVPYVISQHAADRAILDPRRRSRRPVGELLASSSMLVTRFSTLGYEALVRGTEMAYHNPHGERVATFSDPLGAFVVTRSTAELVDRLAAAPIPGDEVRRRAAAFLAEHLVLEGSAPAELAADAIVARIG